MEQFVGLSGAALRCSEVNLGALGPAFQRGQTGLGTVGKEGPQCGPFGHTGGQHRRVGDLGTLGVTAAVWAILGTLGASAAVWAIWARWGVSAAESAHLLPAHAGAQCVEGVGTRGCVGLTRCGRE